VTNSNRFDFVLGHFDSKYLVWHIRAVFREYLMIATSSQTRADLIGKSVRFCVDRHMKRLWKCVHHHFLILNFIDHIILSHIWSTSSNLETSVHVNLAMLIDSSRPGLCAGMVEIFQFFWPFFYPGSGGASHSTLGGCSDIFRSKSRNLPVLGGLTRFLMLNRGNFSILLSKKNGNFWRLRGCRMIFYVK
jgi:hypothetical protein